MLETSQSMSKFGLLDAPLMKEIESYLSITPEQTQSRNSGLSERVELVWPQGNMLTPRLHQSGFRHPWSFLTVTGPGSGNPLRYIHTDPTVWESASFFKRLIRFNSMDVLPLPGDAASRNHG